LTDAQLLDRFVRERDEAAFEVLVWRHGPAVLGVCCRALGDTADADDAFQAVFLTLVRKAAAVRRGDALAAWLCRVAFRISVRLRADRRRRAHAALPEVEAPPVPAADAGLRAALDVEIDGLPEAFRRAFVLCYLDGQTTAEAARIMGCPRGTLLSRLAAARKRLRRRLTHRGLAPAGLLAAAGVTWPSGELVAATVALVKTFAAGAAVPRHVVALSQGVIRAMILNKVKFAASLALAVGVLGLGAGWLTRGPTAVADSQPVAKAEAPKAAPPKPAAPVKPDPGPDDPLRDPKLEPPQADHPVDFHQIQAAEAEAARQEKIRLLQKASDTYRHQLRDLDQIQIQQTTAARSNAIEIEERIRMTERVREMHRKAEGGQGLGGDPQALEKELVAREEKHMQQIVALRQRLVKLETERTLQEREHAEKREEIAAKLHFIAEQTRELELGPARAERPTAADLERRVAAMERDLAELRRELKRR
jgi:RNA polymerase sigma factor (sigma-70 family)